MGLHSKLWIPPHVAAVCMGMNHGGILAVLEICKEWIKICVYRLKCELQSSGCSANWHLTYSNNQMLLPTLQSTSYELTTLHCGVTGIKKAVAVYYFLSVWKLVLDSIRVWSNISSYDLLFIAERLQSKNPNNFTQEAISVTQHIGYSAP